MTIPPRFLEVCNAFQPDLIIHSKCSITNIANLIRCLCDIFRQVLKIVRDVLIHVIIEELHHRGEIIAILWQMNFQPSDMGWLSIMEKTNPSWVLSNKEM
jgi:hypothetical protein